MKIFWSWQSDTPGNTGRYLVRDAIAEAIKKLKQDPDIEEPTERDRLAALHLDQDRQGLSGSPDLAKAIFDKIDAASVVIADATIVCRAKGKRDANGKRVKGRAFINPNVGIELGYALKALGDSNLLVAVNTHYGPTEDLPFDLRHKAISLVYSLAEDADKAAVEAARAKLVATLLLAMRHYINAPAAVNAALEIVKQPAKRPPAFYFDPMEILARIGQPDDDELQFSMAANRAMYMRLIPTRKRDKPLTPRELSDKSTDLGALWIRDSKPLSRSNERGQILIQLEGSHGPNIVALTQVFFTGEIWGLNAWLMRDRAERKPRVLSALPFEQTYFDSLHRYVRFAHQQLGILPPFAFEAGLTGAQDFSLVADYDISFGPIRQNDIVFEHTLTSIDDSALAECLLLYFERVYDHTPYPRPINDWGFPPSPPMDPRNRSR